MRSLSASRIAPRNAVIGALALGTTLSATALALAQSPPPSVPERPTALRAPVLVDKHLRLGQAADVRGQLARDAAGRRVLLQFAPRGQRWRQVAEAVVAPDGRYRFHQPLRASGALRVVMAPEGEAVAGGGAVGTVVAAGEALAGSASQLAVPSRARRVTVAGRIVVRRTDRDVQAGDAVHVRGTLLPRSRGRRVVVESGADGRWRVVARSRTRANGHFDARVVAPQVGTQKLRVRFTGDRRNVAARARAGTLQAFRPSLASWYALYGNRTACGQTLTAGTLGVAHKTLPCGTRVTFRYGGREVTVPVIDRGPFSGAREWDLTGATARALGFGGVGTVWTSV